MVLICWVSLLTKRLHSKEEGYDPSSTLSLGRKWGPSTRNIIRSIDSGRTDRLENEAEEAAGIICLAPLQVLPGGKFSIPRSEGSALVFIRRPLRSLDFEASDRFIPTPNLIDIFDRNHQRRQNINSVDLFFMLSSHSLTRTAAAPTIHYRPAYLSLIVYHSPITPLSSNIDLDAWSYPRPVPFPTSSMLRTLTQLATTR